MSCTKCQQKKPCTTTNDCACEVYLTSDCVNNVKTEFECLEIATGLSLTETLKAMDEQFCVKFDTITNYFTLINLGTGEEVYKGVNNLGQKEFKTLVKTGNLITITSDANTVIIGLDETALNTYVEANQKLTVVSNAGSSGETLVNTAIVTGDTTNYPIKRIIHSAQNGSGESVVRDLQVNPNDLTLRTKKINSSTLTITSNEDNTEVLINTPTSATIPALYVNNLYVPTEAEFLAGNTKGNGSLAKPFTDTVTAYVAGVPTIAPNTAIQNALDAFIGTGIGGDGVNPASALNPKLSGQRIIVQNNNAGYTFSSNLGISNLYLVLEESINSTTTGYLVDMDDATKFNSTSSVFTIEIKEGKVLQIQGLGFRNSGNTSFDAPQYDTGRVGILLGEGEIYTDYNGADVLTRYIFNGDGNNNDSQLHFQVKCKVRATHQGIYFTKNRMRIDFYNQITSGIFLGSINTATKAFHMTGGQVRFYEKGVIAISSEVSGRTYGVTFDPASDTIGECNFELNSARVTGNSRWCFAKLSAGDVNFIAFNSPSGNEFSTTTPGTSSVVDGLFENLDVNPWGIEFKNNVFSFTGIDQTKVDLTQGNNTSSINFIGSDVLETLVVFNSKATALAFGRKKGSKFLKRVTVNAVDLVAGVEYKVATSGSPSLGTVGSYFTATGSETGTGTAYLETIEIL